MARLASHTPEALAFSGCGLRTTTPTRTARTREMVAASSAAKVPVASSQVSSVRLVGTADDESTAVQWLTGDGNEAQLVIVDLFLKGGSGMGVLRCAQSLRPRCKMVVLSNYATPDVRRKCLELGADRVFDKSNEIDALIAYCGALAAGDTSPMALN